MHQDGRHDFDFLFGKWHSHHHRLRERLKGSTEWEEFEGVSVARPILGGIGNIDEIVMERASGQVEGATVRLFDLHTRQWWIYWSDSHHGTLELPMIGHFENGRGEFYSQEPFERQYIFSRFIWSEITPTSCKWEQAFSPDGGKTWETNWVMRFTRIE